jgi:hypothetical protein
VTHGLPIGDPDDVLLTVDAQRGVRLRTEARIATVAYRVVEMNEVSFDEAFAPGVVEIKLPEGRTGDAQTKAGYARMVNWASLGRAVLE